jgi:hypothetical protein
MENLLDTLTEQQSENILKSIQEGDRISANLYQGNFIYRIDDPIVDQELGTFPDDASFYLKISHELKPMGMPISVFPPDDKGEDGRIVAPFSRAVQQRKGDCLEKSVLVQLRKQREGYSFLIKGLLLHEALPYSLIHAYNIVFQDEKPFLVDAQNTVIVPSHNGKTELPYVVPIVGLNKKEFVIGEGWSNGRRYSLV